MSTRRLLWIGAVGALAFGGLFAAAGLSPASVLAVSIGVVTVGVAVVLTHRGTTGRWLRTASKPSPQQLDTAIRALASTYPGLIPFPPLPEVGPATDEDLCRAWCASYRVLQGTASRRRYLAIVKEREGQLDEMERRNPAAFAAWLASGARASDNPLAYLSRASVDPVVIDWDELIDGQGQ